MTNPNYSTYQNPLISRYASGIMSSIWSPQKKFSTWRRLWLALATSQKELGLPITDAQIAELEQHLDNIDFKRAEQIEEEVQHDVMSHVLALGEICTLAKPIIHLGATSCFVTDNSELIQIKESLTLIRQKLLKLIGELKDFSLKYRKLPTLGFTHFQPAQLTTVGKRASLWLYDLVLDLNELDFVLNNLPFRGVKGTTGTQASFLALFNGDHDKVKELEQKVANRMGFNLVTPVSGQTYTRKFDARVLFLLSQLAQSTNKMATDIRLLSHLREIEEPFGEKQIGSSAMAYKRNPMRSERVCALSRFVMSLTDNGAHTHANQWMERTLDDSANRRLSLPQAFLAIDTIIEIMTKNTAGLQVWPEVIKRRIIEELPFMATEEIIMECVKKGGDRQELHEAIRVHSREAAKVFKTAGKPNDLLHRIKNDRLFTVIHSDIDGMIAPERFIGRSIEQVEEFIASIVEPLLK
jgi:adenylosuccinate lyase